MANESGKKGLVLPALLVGFGAFLALVAILLPTYLVPGQKVTPLELGPEGKGSTSVTNRAPAVLLDAAAYASGTPTASNRDRAECRKEEAPAPGQTPAAPSDRAPRQIPMSCFMDQAVEVYSQRFVIATDPSDADKVTFQATQTLNRTDRRTDAENLLSASLDRVTYDRRSAMPVGSNSTLQIQSRGDQSANSAVPFAREGISYKFPFDVEKKSYQYYDLQMFAASEMKFVKETTTEPGLVDFRAFHFRQEIPATNLYEATRSHLNLDGTIDQNDELTLAGFRMSMPASRWGLEGDDEITMDRYYTNVREVWVDPATGQIVKGRETMHQFFAKDQADAERFVSSGAAARETDRPTRTAVKFVGEWNKETIASARGVSQEAIDKMNLAGKTLPLVFGIVGVLLLVGGFVIGSRRTRGGGTA